MRAIQYAAGEAFAIVTPDLVMLVGVDDPAVAHQLWEVVADGPDAIALIGILGASGFAQMPDFACIQWTDEQLRIVVRGSCLVEVVNAAGRSTYDGTGVATWSERSVRPDDVQGVLLRTTGTAETSLLPLVRGVVRASEVAVGDLTQPPSSSPQDGPERAELEDSAGVAETEGAAGVDGTEGAAGVDESEDAADGDESEDAADGDEETPDQQMSVAAPPAAVSADQPPTPVLEPVAEEPADAALTLLEPDEENFDALFGATVAGRSPEDAAIRDQSDSPETYEAPLVSVAGGPPLPTNDPVEPVDLQVAGDHDHRTMTPEEFARLRDASRAVASAGSDGGDQAPAGFELHFSTGKHVTVDRPVLVGRSPQARNASSASLPQLVVINDPYVSGTHLELAVVDGALLATDLSSNGTEMVTATGTQILVKGQATVVPDRATLRISDDVTVQVAQR